MESASSSGGQVAAAAAAASPSLRGFCRTCNSARADDGTCNCVCLFCREGRHHSRLCPRRAEHDRFAPPPPPLPPPPAPAEGDAADEKGQGTNKGTTATATAHHPPPTAPPQQTRAGGGNNSGKEAGKPAPLDAKAGATIGTGAGAGRPRRSPRQRWWRRRPRGSTVYGAQENHRLSLPEALKGLAQPPPLSRRLRAQLRRRLARARRQLRRLRRRGREAGGGLCRCARVVVTRCCCTRPRLAAAPAPACATEAELATLRGMGYGRRAPDHAVGGAVEGEGLALLHRAVGWARSAAAAGGGGGERGERDGGVGGGGFDAAVDVLERRSTGLRLTLTPLADGLPALQVSVPSFRRVGWRKPAAAAAAATGGGATLGTVRRFFLLPCCGPCSGDARLKAPRNAARLR
jgi:hypothetical protein